ncbi:hypothetical protein C7B79_18100 [Chroococcidiopsis cubana CCALA 043]|nr:hypothetical protein C7B79_18100 [Chroococcidiopsis cubana CCALA 043]
MLVRLCVAKNPNTPGYILEKVADDRNRYIRKAVINHAHILGKTLVKLSCDRDRYVRRAANIMESDFFRGR